jgi:hypothetical protein
MAKNGIAVRPVPLENLTAREPMSTDEVLRVREEFNPGFGDRAPLQQRVGQLVHSVGDGPPGIRVMRSGGRIEINPGN